MEAANAMTEDYIDDTEENVGKRRLVKGYILMLFGLAFIAIFLASGPTANELIKGTLAQVFMLWLIGGVVVAVVDRRMDKHRKHDNQELILMMVIILSSALLVIAALFFFCPSYLCPNV